jgi:Ca-activated chloride channel homolog
MAQAGTAPQSSSPSSAQSSVEPSSQSSPPAAKTPQAPQSSTGQSSNDSGADTDDVLKIRVGINEVNVVFTVTDKHGRRVTDLKQNDFRIVDDSKPAAEVRSFHAETNLPLQVGLLIDASSSVRDRFKFEQESAIEFLNQTLRKRYDQAFVVGFDATPEVTQDFTDDTERLAHGVRELRPGGGTALYDALYYACRDKLLKSAADWTDATGDYPAERWRRQPKPRNARGINRNGAARGCHHLHDQHKCERHQGSG